MKHMVNEDHKPKHIYSIKFCDTESTYYRYFASAGANSLNVYKVSKQDEIHLVQAFLDEDETENYYTCDWGSNSNG